MHPDACSAFCPAQQVEFYFSDSNLFRDNFLFEKVKADAEGFVDIGLLSIFSRMKTILGTSAPGDGSAASDETIADVAASLKNSTTLVLSDDQRRVRRAQPMTNAADAITAEVDERSLYAGPFPFTTTLDQLIAFFEEVGDVNCVRMRRHVSSKDFKGSVFVELSSKAEADRIKGLALEFEGAPLVLEPKVDYVKRKEEERHARPNSPHNNIANPGPAGPKRAREEEDDQEVAAATGADGEPGREGRGEGAEAEEAVTVPEFVPGCLVYFDFGTTTTFGENPVSYGLVKDSFGGKERGLSYVDYSSGDTQGIARFASPEAAAAAIAESGENGRRMIAGYEATVRAAVAEEEIEYMKKVAAAKAVSGKERRSGGGGGSRGQHGDAAGQPLGRDAEPLEGEPQPE